MFDHEVRKTLAYHARQPQASELASAPEEKYPLPPEGQPASESAHGAPQSSEGQEWDEEYQWSPSMSFNSPKASNARYWKAGWYLWVSKSRWAAQEKMDLMMCDLAKQAEWQKYKERMNADWAEYEKQSRSIGDLAVEDIGAASQETMPPPPSQTQAIPTAAATQGQQAIIDAPVAAPAGPPFPDVG